MQETERLTEVEIALTHQQALVEELSDLARAQAVRIDRLERLVDEVVRRLMAADADAGPAPEADRRPPHW